MKNNLKRLIATLSLAGWLVSPGATAAVFDTSTITYQGVLEQAGVPPTGAYDFQFTVFNVVENGSPLATVAIEDVPVQDGVFTVQIDLGFEPAGEDLWLEIAVSEDSAGGYTTLLPRQPLTAVPYALKAESAVIDAVNDADADPANELQDLAGVLGQGNDAGAAAITNVGALDVATLTVPTGATAGAVLTSDNAGNATWQMPAGGGIVLGAQSLIGPYGSGGDTAWSFDCPEGSVVTGIDARVGPGPSLRSFRLVCTTLTTSLGVNPVNGASITVAINFGATQVTEFTNPLFGVSLQSSDCPAGMVMTGAEMRNSGSDVYAMRARCTEAGPGTGTGTGPLLGNVLGAITSLDCPPGTVITGGEGLYGSVSSRITTTNFRCR